jgi:hypothetical protein
MTKLMAYYVDEGNPTLTQRVKGLCKARRLPIETDVETESQIIRGYWVTEEVFCDAVAEIEAEQDQTIDRYYNKCAYSTLVDLPLDLLLAHEAEKLGFWRTQTVLRQIGS